MAPQADLVLVVGDRRSNNSNRLVQVAQELAAREAHLVDSVDEIDPAWLKGKRKVAVTSGASTPTIARAVDFSSWSSSTSRWRSAEAYAYRRWDFRALVSLLADQQEAVARAAWDELLAAAGRGPLPGRGVRMNPDRTCTARTRPAGGAAHRRSGRAVAAPCPAGRRSHRPGGRLSPPGCAGRDGGAGARVASFLDAVAGSVRAHMPSVGGLRDGRCALREPSLPAGRPHQPRASLSAQRPGAAAGCRSRWPQCTSWSGSGWACRSTAWPCPIASWLLYAQADQPAYVDCSNRGQVYRHETLSRLLPPAGEWFHRPRPRAVQHQGDPVRMLNNLERLYTRVGQERLVERVRRWRELLVVKGRQSSRDPSGIIHRRLLRRPCGRGRGGRLARGRSACATGRLRRDVGLVWCRAPQPGR